ncbi:hypothetical protein [uncultured Shimia sp.]|uniref:hypothetical protein n=1 Tax=uncultured Shimia sp. TaxID=573152 RepID=UPI00261F8DAF|nr:hypothetical protein [uncultured Shimia sp.]
MTGKVELVSFVEDTLSLLEVNATESRTELTSDVALGSLLVQCQRQVEILKTTQVTPLRVVHHFACSGGTLITRALACQPNTMVLSEVDPFSSNARVSTGFAPSDLIHLARNNRNPPSQKTIVDMFLQQLEVLYKATDQRGENLVVRDHSHSHFCEFSDLSSRPTMGSMLASRFETRAILSVRHPLDSYMSLRRNGWARNLTGTLEGYANCYLSFLDSYRAPQIFHYEHFVQEPDVECKRMAECLELPFEPRWQDFLPTIKLSGDSGRSSPRITARSRRDVPDTIKEQLMKGCRSYHALCDRLNYNPDPDAPAVVVT